PVQVPELAAELVAGLEAGGYGGRADAGVGMAAAALREAALVGAEAFQPFVAPGDVALGVGRDAVLGAGAPMRAQALQRLPARAILQADRRPVGVHALRAVHAGAARNKGQHQER